MIDLLFNVTSQSEHNSDARVAHLPTVVVGMYAPFGVAEVYHAMICLPWAVIVALWRVEDPTMGAYIATKGVAR